MQISSDLWSEILFYLPIDEWTNVQNVVRIRYRPIRKKLRALKEPLYKYFTEESALKPVHMNGWEIKHVQNQTEEICLAAVQQNGLALEYVHNQTEAICLAAVQQHKDAIAFVCL